MSKIQFEQITDDAVEIIIAPDTPMEVVQQLTKSLISKGLVEDLAQSTLSIRYFYRPQDSVNQKADELIKSLERLTKNDDENPYSKEVQRRTRERNRINDRRAAIGMPSLTDAQIAAGKAPKPAAPAAPNTSSGPVTISGKPNKLVNEIGQDSGKYSQNTINYGQTKKGEDCGGCGEEDCEQCEMEKSDYGPKKGGQYSVADNARRKARNIGEAVPDVGPNTNVKAYSSKPGQMSAKQQAAQEAAKIRAINAKQPVKRYTPAEIARMNQERGLKKGWGDHLPFPNAEEEMAKLAGQNPVEQGEDMMAKQLANMMNSKAMLNPVHRQPSSEDMIMAGEQMGLGANEQVMKAENKQWGNTINNWLAEAVKPISQRFNSEQEEVEYWSNIKVSDRDDGSSGY